MRLGPTFAATAVSAAVLIAASAASGEPVPATPPGANARPTVAALAPPPILERRSTLAMSGGIAGVAIGSILLVSSAFSGGVQATCESACNHTPVIVGLVAAGATLVAVGIPLIVWGARMVPVAGPAPAVAVVPRRVPAWAGALGSDGWAFRF